MSVCPTISMSLYVYTYILALTRNIPTHERLHIYMYVLHSNTYIQQYTYYSHILSDNSEPMYQANTVTREQCTSTCVYGYTPLVLEGQQDKSHLSNS